VARFRKVPIQEWVIERLIISEAALRRSRDLLVKTKPRIRSVRLAVRKEGGPQPLRLPVALPQQTYPGDRQVLETERPVHHQTEQDK
jgi:hypothetical protein